MIDNDPGSLGSGHRKILDLTNQVCGRSSRSSRRVEVYGTCIQHYGDRRPEGVVNRLFNAPRRREVRVAQSETQSVDTRKLERQLPFNPRTSRDRSRCRHTLRDASGITLSRCAPGNHGPLRNGIDLPVGRIEWRHDQGPSKKALCIPYRGDGDVDAIASAGKRRQCRRDEDRGHIPGPELFTGDVDAQTFEQIGHGFFRKRSVAQPVTAAVESNNEAVAD